MSPSPGPIASPSVVRDRLRHAQFLEGLTDSALHQLAKLVTPVAYECDEVLFEEMQRQTPIDASHAFYLGYEMAKAVTALTLSKNYVQDQALRWGFLTTPEKSHRQKPPERPE